MFKELSEQTEILAKEVVDIAVKIHKELGQGC
jgi:hypothetical protein